MRILIVDDDASIRFGVARYFRTNGYEVDEAADCARGEAAFAAQTPDVALVDHDLPDGNALDLLRRLKRIDNTVPVIVLTGHASIELAVETIKEGAEQFLTKPVELAALGEVISRSLEGQRNRRVALTEKSRQQRREMDPFVGRSAALLELKALATRVAKSESPVLILGETGSGKGVLANWLHRQSTREGFSFVDLNCAGLSREFFESELFGFDKGAFTGATQAKAGLLELGNRGSLFLDEIGDVSVEVQPKLLKVLEEKKFRRLGDVRDRSVDIRLIAATHQNLGKQVESGKFRADLLYRINTVVLELPPLRQRAEDIPLLAEEILQRLGRARQVKLTDEAHHLLQNYRWPGNLRELKNVLERALILSSTDTIDASALRFDPLSLSSVAFSSAASHASAAPVPTASGPAHVGAPAPSAGSLDLTLEENEKQYIERVLAAEGHNVERAAKRLKLPKSTLYYRMKSLAIDNSKRGDAPPGEPSDV